MNEELLHLKLVNKEKDSFALKESKAAAASTPSGELFVYIEFVVPISLLLCHQWLLLKLSLLGLLIPVPLVYDTLLLPVQLLL